jgi:hypothetical protein
MSSIQIDLNSGGCRTLSDLFDAVARHHHVSLERLADGGVDGSVDKNVPVRLSQSYSGQQEE